MPRRSILSMTGRENLLAIPAAGDELIRLYTFSDADLALIRKHRGAQNRWGFAGQLCFRRYPGILLAADVAPFDPLLRMVASQVNVARESWADCGHCEQTRREHLVEFQAAYGLRTFSTLGHYRDEVRSLGELAWPTDKGIVLFRALVEALRRDGVLLPSIDVIERICAEAITRSNKRIYVALSQPLTRVHHQRLDDLLGRRDGGKTTKLAWLRLSPKKPNSRHMMEHIERLKAWQELELPAGIEHSVHQNRLLKIAGEGGQMRAFDLAKFEPQRRYATLVAQAIEGTATVIDEIIDLHDRIIGKLFNAAKNKHQ